MQRISPNLEEIKVFQIYTILKQVVHGILLYQSESGGIDKIHCFL